ncbi:uncharacterized protein LOC143251098 [Tachypleus tridentatus]|uniref:uncharacterized protein LOC143251098 n=1 Tax=Tachypleus tridentatus TaxID=6853 RepID=UPI003FCF8DE1
MKLLVSVIVVFGFALTAVVAQKNLPFCGLDEKQLEVFVICWREKNSEAFMNKYDECKKRYFPDYTDAAVAAIACEGNIKAVHLELCLLPVLNIEREQVTKVTLQCVKEAQ